MAELRDKIIRYALEHKKSILVWAVALISGFMVFKGFMQVPQIRANRAEIERLEEKIKYEKVRQQETDELMTQVDSDDYIEKVASEKLGLIKSNTKVFVDVSQEK